MDLSFSEQLLRVVFQLFVGKFFIYLFLFLLNFLVVKIGCHSRFNPECNTERGFIDSLYIALGWKAYYGALEFVSCDV